MLLFIEKHIFEFYISWSFKQSFSSILLKLNVRKWKHPLEKWNDGIWKQEFIFKNLHCLCFGKVQSWIFPRISNGSSMKLTIIQQKVWFRESIRHRHLSNKKKTKLCGYSSLKIIIDLGLEIRKLLKIRIWKRLDDSTLGLNRYHEYQRNEASSNDSIFQISAKCLTI